MQDAVLETLIVVDYDHYQIWLQSWNLLKIGRVNLGGILLNNYGAARIWAMDLFGPTYFDENIIFVPVKIKLSESGTIFNFSYPMSRFFLRNLPEIVRHVTNLWPPPKTVTSFMDGPKVMKRKLGRLQNLLGRFRIS